MNEIKCIAFVFASFYAVTWVHRLYGKQGLLSWITLSIICANIQVVKIIDVGGFPTTLGNILYASSYLATDIISEKYGRAEASYAFKLSLFCLMASTLIFQWTLWIEPSQADWAHPHLEAILSPMPRILLASLLSFAFSQWHDIWAFEFWKKKFPGRHQLYIRNNLSTVVSQSLDCALFCVVAFWGAVDGTTWLSLFLTTAGFKILLAVIDTPFVYLATKK